MNNITPDNNTNNMNTAAKTAPKRAVAKKADVTVTVTATPVPVAPAAEVKAKAAPKKAVAKAEAPVATAPVAAAPEAQAVAAAAAPVKSVSEEIAALNAKINVARETLREAAVALKTIEKRHNQELKEAKKRRRVKKEVDGEVKAAPKPSVFTTPVTLKSTLAVFLGKPVGTMMSPADVTRAVKVYIDEHKLKGEKHEIHPDVRMCETLGLKAGETLTYKNIQKYLYQLYEKKQAATAAPSA
jgi:hypothetical protein